ncbi:MAG: hypothetical protein HOP30_17660 [Cyclobacteriaceae bacterium]|nr:hypothetical protein [Cyclobacteriaceae bacterium]
MDATARWSKKAKQRAKPFPVTLTEENIVVKKDIKRATGMGNERVSIHKYTITYYYMSHIKNVEAFGKLTGICTGYGGKFKPGNPNLQAHVMSALMNNARQVMSEVHSAKTEYDNATNTRELTFKDIKRLGTRIISALKANGAGKLTIADAQASVRKFNGTKSARKVAEKPNAEGELQTKVRRARGLDFISVAENFAKLVETVSADSSYHVNEMEFSVNNLRSLSSTLIALNDLVNDTTAKLNRARSKRDNLLYGREGNLVDTGMAAKQYVRSALGPKSDEYSEIKQIRFTKPNA